MPGELFEGVSRSKAPINFFKRSKIAVAILVQNNVAAISTILTSILESRNMALLRTVPQPPRQRHVCHLFQKFPNAVHACFTSGLSIQINLAPISRRPLHVARVLHCMCSPQIDLSIFCSRIAPLMQCMCEVNCITLMLPQRNHVTDSAILPSGLPPKCHSAYHPFDSEIITTSGIVIFYIKNVSISLQRSIPTT